MEGVWVYLKYILHFSCDALPYHFLLWPAKTFMHHFTRALRIELKPLCVHITCLIPGEMDTRLLDECQIDRRKAISWHVAGNPLNVDRAGVRVLDQNRPECIPGFLNKLVLLFLPHTQYFVILLIYNRLKNTISSVYLDSRITLNSSFSLQSHLVRGGYRSISASHCWSSMVSESRISGCSSSRLLCSPGSDSRL